MSLLAEKQLEVSEKGLTALMGGCENIQRIFSEGNRVTVTTVTLKNGAAVFSFNPKGFPPIILPKDFP